MSKKQRPLAYVGGDIMSFGSQMARDYECKCIDELKLNLDYYSPAQNKSINDKTHMTEKENNHLAEKIVAADVERLWNSDITVMCPEQHAIGTMVECGILYGWAYMAKKLLPLFKDKDNEAYNELLRILDKKNFYHYFDIRTNHLNEKDWRRSFSINQFLYGVILEAAADNQLHNTFDEILPLLKKECEQYEVKTIE